MSPWGPLPLINDSHKKAKIMTCPLQEHTLHTTTIYVTISHLEVSVGHWAKQSGDSGLD